MQLYVAAAAAAAADISAFVSISVVAQIAPADSIVYNNHKLLFRHRIYGDGIK